MNSVALGGGPDMSLQTSASNAKWLAAIEANGSTLHQRLEAGERLVELRS
ncbi:hypothetical protein [Brevundimonas sp. SL161]